MNNIAKKTLPSNGLLTGTPSEINIRGMKGREISTLFSSLTDAAVNEIIKSVTNPSLNPEELCDEDKMFILHQTRILTFGSEIEQTLRCPFCSTIHSYILNYEDFNFILLDEAILSEKLTLSDGTIIERRVATSDINEEIIRYKDRVKLPETYSFILLIASKIARINDKKKSVMELIEFLENLPGRELVKISKFVDFKFGLDTTFKVECIKCKIAFTGGVGINADLFREPDISL